jgi:hypothetical protein
MKNMIYFTLVALLIFIGLTTIQAAKALPYATESSIEDTELGTLTLKGNVYDSTYSYPAKVKIYIYDLDNGTYKIIDALSGKFSIKLTLGGNYNLIFHKSGYQSKTITINALSENKKDYLFEFDIYINRIETINTKASLISNKVAEIYYDKTKDCFSYVKK